MYTVKKAFCILLALALFTGAAPFALAADTDGQWLFYYEETDEAYTAFFVAPAGYVRLTDEPLVEAVLTDGSGERFVYTPEAEQIRFSLNGVTGMSLTLTVSCRLPDGAVPGYDLFFAVLPGSVADGEGNVNARVYFDDGTEYRNAGGYTDIGVYSGLLRRDYDRADETVAVGDTLRAEYSGLYPVEILVNGETAAAFPGGEMQIFTYAITGTGALRVSVRQNGREIDARSLTVISSEEMYRRSLRDGLITGDDIPGADELVDVGVPAGSPFIFLAKVVAFFVALREFFQRLFSFTRIAD